MVRLLPETQELYAETRSSYAQNSELWLLEDDIQLAMMKFHGFKTSQLHIKTLREYRAAITRHVQKKTVRDAAFFLRLNVVVSGLPVDSPMPRDLTLYALDDLAPQSLGEWMDKARAVGKKLIIMAGSVTW